MLLAPTSMLPSAGSLDGLTILRFTHAYESGGGLEQYLFDLNHALGFRNRVTTIQMQLTTNLEAQHEIQETLGQNSLLKIPLLVSTEDKQKAITGYGRPPSAVSTFVRDHLLFTQPVYTLFTKKYLTRRQVPRHIGEPNGAGNKLQHLFTRYNFDLVIIHSPGGADASEIISASKAAAIPVAMVYHFANDRLASLSLRQQTLEMDGVAGVCGVDVPDYLKSRFVNVADGIDTDFFSRHHAGISQSTEKSPLLFLPARITPSKGQADVLKTLVELRRRGLQVRCAFAGRTDSDAFIGQLRQFIAENKIQNQVEFLGPLGAGDLRKWYASAWVTAFPTYHHEGLPRILMESQAMEVPIVAFNQGGMSDGMVHGKTGFIHQPGDLSGFTDSIYKLLTDEPLRNMMGKAGRKLAVERFGLNALATRHEKYYLDVIHRKTV